MQTESTRSGLSTYRKAAIGPYISNYSPYAFDRFAWFRDCGLAVVCIASSRASWALAINCSIAALDGIGGYGSLPVEQFKIAEIAVEITLSHAHATGEWRLAPDVIGDFEALLTLYDAQLAKARLHEVQDAERQLRCFLAGKSDSPISTSS